FTYGYSIITKAVQVTQIRENAIVHDTDRALRLMVANTRLRQLQAMDLIRDGTRAETKKVQTCSVTTCNIITDAKHRALNANYQTLTTKHHPKRVPELNKVYNKNF
ncbi:unnamed protein product, partial [Owenia fusiformis]